LTPEETIRGLIAAWQANDGLRASAFFAPDGAYQEAGREPIVGREAIAEHFARFFRGGPLFRLDVEEILARGDAAAVCYVFAVKGEGGAWDERAGCAWVRLRLGLLELWREYHR
jgi:uncharacterized protein (TIGR02246 family)